MNNTNSKRTYQLVIIAMFAALMAIGANIAAFLVIGSVPITLQTFFALLAGALLGRRLGATSMIVYLFIGLIGFPVFSQFRGGLSHVINPTFGFIISFVIAAYLTGLIIEKSKEKNTRTFFFAMFISLITSYLFGIVYMYYTFLFVANLEQVSYYVILGWMAAPFVKDFILTIIAALIAKRLYQYTQQQKFR